MVSDAVVVTDLAINEAEMAGIGHQFHQIDAPALSSATAAAASEDRAQCIISNGKSGGGLEGEGNTTINKRMKEEMRNTK